MNKKATAGHITALITIVIWGTTFISTKILLTDFTPIEILFFRFLLGLLVLIAVYPKRLKIKDKKRGNRNNNADIRSHRISQCYVLKQIV